MAEMSAGAYTGRGFELMRPALAEFVCREFERALGSGWWSRQVLPKLPEQYAKNLPKQGSSEEIAASLDVLACFQLIDRNWDNLFRYRLSQQQRTWVKELHTTRNEWAHSSGSGMRDEDAARALDTMVRLMEQIDYETAEKLRTLLREVRGRIDERERQTVTNATESAVAAPSYAKPWRQVALPHPDVAQGTYRNAEFAADLAAVVKGIAEAEYRDPVEFFSRTYITEGLGRLLASAARRVAGMEGEPVIQLKTSFGGGKTHSLLALYHMMRSGDPRRLPGVEDVLKKAGIGDLPKVSVAVIVGTWHDPFKPRTCSLLPGENIRTLWGEIAAQLVEQTGDPTLYDQVREANNRGIAPGAETYHELLERCAPCLILLDEFVAYARKLYGIGGDEAGKSGFENVLSFVQGLTEAVKASKNCLLIASLPESEAEAGGEAGVATLDRLERIFGRIESVWRPVGPEEGFEIVRRRLFREVENNAAEAACRAFFEVYTHNPEDFPPECRMPEYLERMRRCYPIHPEVFDRLYEDWATLETFQRTRGVLRFMASVINELYMRNDSSTMIMPGSIPFGVSRIRDELTKHLSGGWDAIIDREVDGPGTIPARLDAAHPNYGRQFACTRVARAIFLGSAPSAGAQRARGITASRVRLGVAQPQENIPTYNDALARLSEDLSYLYSGADRRYWFDTRPTLKKMAEDFASQVSDDDALCELEQKLKKICRTESPFSAVHTAPHGSGNVPDQQALRLVVFPLGMAFVQNDSRCKALTAAKEYLEKRGDAPRLYRNMLVFLAPENTSIKPVRDEMKKLIAWKGIYRDSDALDLTAAQKREVSEAIDRCERAVESLLKEAYSWLIVPQQEAIGEVALNALRIQGNVDPVSKAAQKLRDDGLAVDVMSPKMLALEMEMYNLWKDRECLPVRELWEYYTQYIYLQRVSSFDALVKAIENGVISGDYFGYADGRDSSGRYQGLRLGQGNFSITPDGLLVKLEAARRQLESQVTHAGPQSSLEGETGTHPRDENSQRGGPPSGGVATSLPQKKTHFFGSLKVEPSKLGSTAGRINQEVIRHIAGLPGAEVRVTIEVSVNIPDGIPEDVEQVIRENCRTMRFDTFDLE